MQRGVVCLTLGVAGKAVNTYMALGSQGLPPEWVYLPGTSYFSLCKRPVKKTLYWIATCALETGVGCCLT